MWCAAPDALTGGERRQGSGRPARAVLLPCLSATRVPPARGGPQHAAGGAGRSGLPPSLDAFVGRERELSRLRTLLRSSRLLTLTGPGGVGKTRLALELAGGVRGARTGRAEWVALDSLRDGELLPQALAAALGVRERGGRAGVEALVHALGTRTTLVVLDNCEHLADACAQLAATLLAHCPRLRILATSRETLRVPGEVVFRVTELSLTPAAEDHDLAGLLRSEAVRLFLERARTSDATFELGRGEARTVAEICRRLDGLPLAIELAAGRAGSLADRHPARTGRPTVSADRWQQDRSGPASRVGGRDRLEPSTAGSVGESGVPAAVGAGGRFQRGGSSRGLRRRRGKR